MSARTPRRAALSVGIIFGLHGLIIGTWVPNIPAAMVRLNVGPGVFGQILLCGAMGAICAMPVAGLLIGRLGSARVTLLSGIAFCISLLGPVFAPDIPFFCMALVIFGISIGTMDVAMNAHGVIVEEALGRPVMSALHGMFSLGAALGVFLGAMLIDPLGLKTFSCLMALLCLAGLVVAARGLLSRPGGPDVAPGHFGWPSRESLLLGGLCFLIFLSEGAVMDWAGLELRASFGVSEAMSGLGYGLFSAGMMVSRFMGDRLRTYMGATQLVRGSALLMTFGLLLALLAPVPGLSIAGYGLAGLGVGNIAPVFFAGSGRIDPQSPGRGIASVTTLGYAGFLIGPPLIGMLAEVTSPGQAMGVLVIAGLVIAAGAGAARAADSEN